MKRLMIAAVLTGTTALAGCGSAVVASLDSNAQPQTARVGAHVVSGPVADGTVASVTDRTSSGVDANATLFIAKVPFTDFEAPTSAQVTFGQSTTDGGKRIPSTARLQAPGAVVDQLIAGQEVDLNNVRYGTGDTFLEYAGAGNGYAAVRYNSRSGDDGFHGYVVGGQTATAEQVAAQSGTASFTGKAVATVFGSTSGRESAEGDTQLTATFAPGGGTIGGTITNLVVGGNAQPGVQVNLAPTAINGDKYNGAASLQGVASSSGNYQGAFYNPEVNGTAGTFHLRASGVTTSAGVQDIEAVGAFGGNR